MDLSNYDWAARVCESIEYHLARFADQIIFNSYAEMALAIQRGFPASKSCVISNGIDTDYFLPDAQGRDKVRGEWGVSSKDRLIGIIGRLAPMKDHPTFIKAASQLAYVDANVRFVCVGEGKDNYRKELQDLGCALGLEDRLIWAGSRLDMPSVYNALDILVSSSSYGEGFSNVIGESMACGVPCVVTNIGDSAMIVGDHGIAVSPGNPESLAQALNDMLFRIQDVDRRHIRQHIVERFSVASMVEVTEKALTDLIQLQGTNKQGMRT